MLMLLCVVEFISLYVSNAVKLNISPSSVAQSCRISLLLLSTVSV